MSKRDTIAVRSHLQRKSRTANLRGQRFGKLVAVEFVKMLPNGLAVWRYHCDCGNIVEKKARNAKGSGHCGCRKGSSRAKDITGTRHGMLVAVRVHETTKRKEARWLFRCDCGGEVVRYPHSARATQHCGCKTYENLSSSHRKHGRSSGSVYKVWAAMKDRCNNPQNTHYGRYGGRGISVCERWNDSFEDFISDMGERPKSMTLERIDNSGNYEPENCRWATRKEQQRNREVNVRVTANGETKCLSHWAEESGIGRSTLAGRIYRGWDPGSAVTTPVHKKHVNNQGKKGSNHASSK